MVEKNVSAESAAGGASATHAFATTALQVEEAKFGLVSVHLHWCCTRLAWHGCGSENVKVAQRSVMG